MSEELKPCPFCGCENIQRVGFDTALCPSCDASHQENKWNTRATGWISVDDRLPDVGDLVLTYANGDIS